MSQLLDIKFPQYSDVLLQEFLRTWQDHQDYKIIAPSSYSLKSSSQDSEIILTAHPSDSCLSLEGYTTDTDWALIEKFSRQYEAIILHDGEPIEEIPSESPTLLGTLISALLFIGVILILPFTILAALTKFVWQLIFKSRS